MMIINLMGMMYWWDISLNAISLVNLVVVSGSIKSFDQTLNALKKETTKTLNLFIFSGRRHQRRIR